MLESLILEKKVEEVYKEYKEKGILDIIENMAPYINRKNYYRINENGDIKIQTANISLSILNNLETLGDSKKSFENILNNYIYKEEKIRIKKIDRLSNEKIEDLERKYIKTLINGEKSFALRYGKELLLRDKNKFYEKTLFFSLINLKNAYYPIITLDAINLIEKLGSRKNYLYPMYVLISFLTSQYNDYKFYEESFSYEKNNNIDKEFLELKNKIENEYKDLEGYKKVSILGHIKSLEFFIKNYKENSKIFNLIKVADLYFERVKNSNNRFDNVFDELGIKVLLEILIKN